MAAPAPAIAPPSPRLESVDLLRGLIMVVMALDHTRDYFHWSALHGIEPTDLAATSAPIFLTRWFTHFCAPIFSLLVSRRDGRVSVGLARKIEAGAVVVSRHARALVDLSRADAAHVVRLEI